MIRGRWSANVFPPFLSNPRHAFGEKRMYVHDPFVKTTHFVIDLKPKRISLEYIINGNFLHDGLSYFPSETKEVPPSTRHGDYYREAPDAVDSRNSLFISRTRLRF